MEVKHRLECVRCTGCAHFGRDVKPSSTLSGFLRVCVVLLVAENSSCPCTRKHDSVTHLEVVTVDDGADPNLQEKMYESRYDFQLEVADVPERWIQAYYTERELLDKEGVRVWTDEDLLGGFSTSSGQALT